MAFFTAASKADFQHQLQAALAQHISEQALPQVALFAEQFFGIISLDELTQRRLSDLAGCTLSAWRIIERFYRLYPTLITRFYAGRSSLKDKIRILTGTPPVPVGRAIRVLRTTAWR